MLKFKLVVKTKDGLLVENLAVHARDKQHAEEKIEKVYLNCEVIKCEEINTHANEDDASIESIISLISKNDEN